MGDKYIATRKGKKVQKENPLTFLELNAIFSTIYNPNTPTTNTRDNTIRHYQKMDDDFYVLNDTKGVLIKGKISSTLINKLKNYRIKLKRIK